MRLVVDTSVLVGELLRATGRDRLSDQHLELFLPEQMAEELTVELPRRIAAFARRRHLESDVERRLVEACAQAIDSNVTVLNTAVYSAAEMDARARVPRDEHDRPVAASAMVLSGGIWTHDHDFLGCGVPTWTTDTLSRWLSRSWDVVVVPWAVPSARSSSQHHDDHPA